ncbi:EamA family transporter [Sneathiella sp. P13V-1]|uniref:DMT family transporter n=1 Tax=Sneathiella sp. P13V-1 TaxID=2697366 RepID=UPI00187BBA6A|nr:DMT family transporter [Sneathiella sp. P13V-1]MBE7635524.1 EamA family transporter [Sneathiella sp. P13V-1]
MRDLLKNPVALLLATGALIGFNFPLGKISAEAGVPPMVWALVLSAGVCLTLLPLLLLGGKFSFPKGKAIRYVVISAVISFVIPNILLFTVIPHVGSGFSGLMFALSPVFTLTISLMARLKGPSFLGVVGIVLGLIGATIVSFSRSQHADVSSYFWILAALAVPLSLAFGNVYRTIDWPEGESPDALAFWSHAVAVIIYLILLGYQQNLEMTWSVFNVPEALLFQLVFAGMTFPLFFRLQKAAGPVLLSQIGYVAAAVGLLAATLFLGEIYSPLTWVGAAVITVGICVTIAAEIRKPKRVALAV